MAETPTSAPGDLDLVRRFVNSLDIEGGTERLDSPEALARWLQEAGIEADAAQLTAADVERARAVREALRGVLLTHNGAEPDPSALEVLADAAARAPLRVGFGAHGAPVLEPAAGGLEGGIARLLAIVARADAEGTWPRLKACTADECRWAFYDHSRNRSRTWCDMSICGNRAKARAYRARTGGGGGG